MSLKCQLEIDSSSWSGLAKYTNNFSEFVTLLVWNWNIAILKWLWSDIVLSDIRNGWSNLITMAAV